MKRVLLLHTGGTLGMTGGRPSPLRPEAFASTVSEFVPELRRIADVDFEVLFNIDSSDIQPEQIVEIARFIHERYERYDGFVVIHGTDAMVYTASALAFLFRGLSKPVVLTGSQRPIAEIRSDAKPNLIAACVVAADPRPIPEVAVFFGTVLLRGCRAKKLHTAHFDAFSSPNCPPLATMGVEIERGGHVRAAGAGIQAPTALSPKVMSFRLSPGLDPSIPERLLESGVRGIVLDAYGSGNIPVHGRPFARFLEVAAAKKIPVVLATQCVYGGVSPGIYEGGQAAMNAGAISAADMTTEACIAKLQVLLGRDAGVEQVRAAFAEDWAGERIGPPALAPAV